MGCETCKSKGKTKFNFMMFIAVEVFIVSIYGHIELIKKLNEFISFLF